MPEEPEMTAAEVFAMCDPRLENADAGAAETAEEAERRLAVEASLLPPPAAEPEMVAQLAAQLAAAERLELATGRPWPPALAAMCDRRRRPALPLEESEEAARRLYDEVDLVAAALEVEIVAQPGHVRIERARRATALDPAGALWPALVRLARRADRLERRLVGVGAIVDAAREADMIPSIVEDDGRWVIAPRTSHDQGGR